MNGLKSKRGNIFVDLALFVAIIFALAMIGLVIHWTLDAFNTELQADPTSDAKVKAKINSLSNNYSGWSDSILLLVFVFLWIFVLVSSFLLDTHPIFFVISLILLVILFIVVMILANTFDEFTQEPEFTNYDDDFPITYFIMNKLLILYLCVGGSMLISLYAKNTLT